MSIIARVWLVGVPRLVTRLLSLHRYLLLVPVQLVLAGCGCMALAASSDLANTFNSPRAGGPAIALLLFGTLVLAFFLFVACLPECSAGSTPAPATSLTLADLSYSALVSFHCVSDFKYRFAWHRYLAGRLQRYAMVAMICITIITTPGWSSMARILMLESG